MSTKKKTNKTQFWLVVLGLFFMIGLVVGGTYVLDEQGLISTSEMSGERSEGAPADFTEGTERPTRPDSDDEGMGLNAQAFQGLFQVILQIGVVVVVVVVSKRLYAWLSKFLPRSRTA